MAIIVASSILGATVIVLSIHLFLKLLRPEVFKVSIAGGEVMTWLQDEVREILQNTRNTLKLVTGLSTKVDQLTANVAAANKKLDELLQPPLEPPDHFVVTESTITKGANIMARAKSAKLKVVLLDNGTAKATATPVDSVGINTVLPTGSSTPVWTASDPGVVISPDASDTTGLTAVFGPASPPVLVGSFTVSVDCVLPDGSTHVSGTSEDNSIVAGGPTGFKVAVA